MLRIILVYLCLDASTRIFMKKKDFDNFTSEITQTVQGLARQINLMQQEIHKLRQDQSSFTLQVARERLMNEISRHIHRSLDLDEILDTAAYEVRQFLKTDRVLIYRFKPDWNGVVTVESVAPGISPVLYTYIEEPCFRQGYVPRYQQGRVRAIDDIETADLGECHRMMLRNFQVRANLVVPILQGEVLWGLLIAHHCRGPRQWQAQDTTLLQQLATQIGIAAQKSELHQEVQRLSEIDSLTQLANRRRFDRYLRDIWVTHQRLNQPMSLLLADIDFFKQYNDIYGHPAGDDCLAAIAHSLNEVTERRGDLVARYGGEEFAIVLPSTDIRGAIALAEDILADVRMLEIEHRGSIFEQITLSIGVASIVPHSDQSPVSLIQGADKCLYQAKHRGRNRIEHQTLECQV